MVFSEVVLWAMSVHCGQLYAQQITPILIFLIISEKVKTPNFLRFIIVFLAARH
jgi:hypothetical protein